MTIRLRPVLVILAGLSMLLGTFGQVTGSFDDDDPDNDPNFCASVADAENCDWTCGWYQAAVNLGHISLEAARTACPDLQRTDWLPEEVRVVREAERAEDVERYTDDDPTNDPNVCFESSDPNCDWEAGWYASLANIAQGILEDESISPAKKEAFLSFWEAYLSYEPDAGDDPPGGNVNRGNIRWFCPPGVEECSRPANLCAPGQNPTDGDCYFYG